MSTERFAAIDIGTVTTRLMVADRQGSELHELVRTSIITNLGEGVDATGVLKPEAMERVFVAVRTFLQTISQLESDGQPIKVIAMATSASRDAKNASEFVQGLADLGITLTVIPGEREAALSFLGAGMDYAGQPILVSDIGGGSTEIIAGVSGQQPLFAHSFNIGCRRVTERFLKSNPETPQEVAAARDWIRQQFEPYFTEIRAAGFAPEQVVSVAGTATSMVSIREKMAVYDRTKVHGVSVSAADLDTIYAQLAPLTLEQRKQVVGLQPERACVIDAGIIILQELLRAAGAAGFVASESDILHGIILTAEQ